MSFLLGSFTSGMFSGFNDVQNGFLKGEEYKQQHIKSQQMQDMMDAAKATGDAANNQRALNTSGAGAPQADTATIAPTTASSVGPVHSDNLPSINLDKLPKPNYMSTDAAGSTTRHLALEQNNYGSDGGAAPVDTSATMPGGQPVSGQLARERSGYDQSQTPNPGASDRAQSGVFKAPITTSPTNMPTYDVPSNMPGAFSSGQSTPQADAVNGVDAPRIQPTGIGPDLSHLNNNPVGGTLGNWLHGRPTPRYLPPGSQPVSQALPTRPRGPGLASNTSGLGAQILAAMNPTAGPTA